MKGIKCLTALTAILLGSLAILGVGIEKTGVAAAFSDPVSRIRAQDESIYANSSITMALKGGWMTPKVLGRICLLKPPLQLWLSGLSLKLLGVSLFALRLPMLIAGAVGAVLVYCWCDSGRSAWPGLIAVLLLLSNPVWQMFSRLCYTDLLLAVFTLAALYCLVRDPTLARRATFLGFGAATAAAIMTKNVAGLVPILVLFLAAAWMHGGQRPAWPRIVEACLLTALLIAPWHLYQLVVHPRWFWMDYVQLELLRIGMRPPAPTTNEFSVVFYARRLFLVDPFLCVLAMAATPGLAMAAWRRDSFRSALLASWLVVAFASLCAFQSHFFHYAVLLIAPLCLLAACYGPLASRRWQPAAIMALCAVFAMKSLVHEHLWSLTFGRGTPLAAASILRAYSDLARPNALVLVNTDDEFDSATLPLPKVHYCFLDLNGVVERYGPHYVPLGITVTADQYAELSRWEPQFREKLRGWGQDSIEPLATAIVARSDADVLTIVRTHPAEDFYLPARFLAQVEPFVGNTHDIRAASAQRFLLLARSGPPETAQSTLPLAGRRTIRWSW